MNLVGKIFVVLILVMSLVFMSFAVVVYATHHNWKDVAMRPESETGPDKPLGLAYLVKKQDIQIQELRDQEAALKGELEAQRKDRDQAIAKHDTQYGQLKDQYDELETGYARLVKERRDAHSALNSIQIVLGHLRTEVDFLRQAAAEAEKDRDAHFNQVVKLTDENHQLINEYDCLKKRLLERVNEANDLKGVLRYHGLSLKIPAKKAPPVDGVVLAVTEPDLCEISVGSDDGLQKGHLLIVYRKSGGSKKYVGRIIVKGTESDRSACWIEPRSLQSPVQQTDLVTSRIEMLPLSE